MRHAALLPPALVLALLGGAAAQEPAGPPADGAAAVTSTTWRLRLGDREVGTEEASVTPRPGGGWVVASRGVMRLTAEPFRFEQRLEVDAAGRPLAYRLDSKSLAFEVVPEGDDFVVRGQIMGNRQMRRVQGEGPWVCLDNLMSSHYDVLGQLLVDRREPLALRALVPQGLTGVAGTVRPGEPGVAHGPGGPRATRAWALTLGNVLVHLDVDARDGRTYRMRVPAQRLEALRDGWTVGEGDAPGPVARAGALPEGAVERAVTIPGPACPLPGTLTLPAPGPAKPPVVLLLAGSGLQDRDETIGANKPLRDLAHGLAARGVASLRYDRRTVVLVERLRAAGDGAEGEGARAEARAALLAMTFADEVIDDAAAALTWLRAQPDVRGDALFVAGHSLGAVAAPEVARASPPVRGLATLAGPGRRLDLLMEEQITFQATLTGLSEAEARLRAKEALAPLAERGARLREEESVMGASGRYWRDVLARDPVALFGATDLPVLVLQGAADCQVRRTDYDLLLGALEARPGGAQRGCVFPGLNHLFFAVSGPSTGAEYHEPGRMDPAVAEELAGWVRQLAGAGGR